MSGFSEVDVGRAQGGKSGGSGHFINITVSDPVKTNEGINAFITYKVNTTTDRPEFQYGPFSVVRRYSDFVWVHSKICSSFPGCIIPPLPEKLLVGRFSPEFVEARRRNLEKFLNRVANHPELVTSKHFASFLTAEDGLANSKEETKRNAIPPPKKMFEFFNEAVNKVQHTFQHSADLVKSPNDATFEQINTYVNSLEVQLMNVQKHTGTLIKKGRETSNALFEFGLAVTLLGQSEVGGLSESLKELGRTADVLSVTTAEEAEKEDLQFDDPITEYCRLVAAVKAALHKRQEARAAYAHALAELETKQALQNKLAAQAGKEDKARAAGVAVQNIQHNVDETKKEFDIVSERFLREFERFKEEKGSDLKKIMTDYVTLQLEYHKKMEKSWGEVLPKLQAADAGGEPDSRSGRSQASSAQRNIAPPADSYSTTSSYQSNPFGDRESLADSTLVGV